MKGAGKLVALSAGIFAVAVASNIAAKAIYTNSKIGTDKKALLLSFAAGVGACYLVIKNM